MRSVIFILLALSSKVFAQPFENINRERAVCFAKKYTEQQLQQRPLQTVSSLAVQLYQQPDPADPTIYLNLQAQVGAETHDTNMICDRLGDQLNCAVECDGGQAEITSVGQNPRQLQFLNKGFLLAGGCSQSEEQEEWLTPTPEGDDLFFLDEMDNALCP